MEAFFTFFTAIISNFKKTSKGQIALFIILLILGVGFLKKSEEYDINKDVNNYNLELAIYKYQHPKLELTSESKELIIKRGAIIFNQNHLIIYICMMLFLLLVFAVFVFANIDYFANEYNRFITKKFT